jgi:hypothetical protein
MKQRTVAIVGTALVIAALAYLRDPSWLIGVDSGFRRWETTADGTRYRWISGHASFFVRSDAEAIDIPVRTTVSLPTDVPVTVTVSVDDRFAAQLVLNDAAWQHAKVMMPARGSRRVRRIDIRVDRTKAGNRGVQVGDVRIR